MTHFYLTTPLTSLNTLKGRHWSARTRGKTAWTAELTLRRTHALAPRTPPNHRQTLTIERLMHPGEREFDHENLTAGNAKALVDCLTTLGFWRDDSPRWLDRAYHQRRATPDEITAGHHTLVEITRALQ